MARPRRPRRNTTAQSWCADVRRFLRPINTDEVLGTHTGPRLDPTRPIATLQSLTSGDWLCVPKTSSNTLELAGPRWLTWRRLVCSSSPSATILWRTALCGDFAARKCVEFAAFCNRPLHLGTRLIPKSALWGASFSETLYFRLKVRFRRSH